MLIDNIVTWVGLVTVVSIVACGCFLCCAWMIHKTLDNIRMIKLILHVYWNFYNSIKDLPEDNYSKFRVTWDRTKGTFTDAEGIR